jgi:hypothetical protein
LKKNVGKSIEIAPSNKEISEIKEELTRLKTSYLTPILKSLGESDDNISKFIENEVKTGLKPWTRYFYAYNPSDEFEK